MTGPDWSAPASAQSSQRDFIFVTSKLIVILWPSWYGGGAAVVWVLRRGVIQTRLECADM